MKLKSKDEITVKLIEKMEHLNQIDMKDEEDEGLC